MSVKWDVKGLGIGAKLMKFAENLSIENGFNQVTLNLLHAEACPQHDRLLKWYVWQGYRETSSERTSFFTHKYATENPHIVKYRVL